MIAESLWLQDIAPPSKLFERGFRRGRTRCGNARDQVDQEDLVAIPGFNLERLNPKEFAVFSFVSSRAIALEHLRTPQTALITYTR